MRPPPNREVIFTFPPFSALEGTLPLPRRFGYNEIAVKPSAWGWKSGYSGLEVMVFSARQYRQPLHFGRHGNHQRATPTATESGSIHRLPISNETTFEANAALISVQPAGNV